MTTAAPTLVIGSILGVSTEFFLEALEPFLDEGYRAFLGLVVRYAKALLWIVLSFLVAVERRQSKSSALNSL